MGNRLKLVMLLLVWLIFTYVTVVWLGDFVWQDSLVSVTLENGCYEDVFVTPMDINGRVRLQFFRRESSVRVPYLPTLRGSNLRIQPNESRELLMAAEKSQPTVFRINTLNGTKVLQLGPFTHPRNTGIIVRLEENILIDIEDDMLIAPTTDSRQRKAWLHLAGMPAL